MLASAGESADQARLDKVEKCSQEAALSKQRAGHPSQASPLPPSPLLPKPISSVLARFYHGAVHHRLPRQYRCCSHCAVHGDAVVTHIPFPNIPTGRIKRVGYDCEASRVRRCARVESVRGCQKEGRKKAWRLSSLFFSEFLHRSTRRASRTPIRPRSCHYHRENRSLSRSRLTGRGGDETRK